jgi:hypothetical protein
MLIYIFHKSMELINKRKEYSTYSFIFIKIDYNLYYFLFTQHLEFITITITMSLVAEFICDFCKSRSLDPHFKIGEKYGEPLHAHKECIPALITMVNSIISNSTIKTELDFTGVTMISEDTIIPPMIDAMEEMKKPEIREKIMVVIRRMPIFIQKLNLTNDYIEENNGLIGTLTTWDCLFD